MGKRDLRPKSAKAARALAAMGPLLLWVPGGTGCSTSEIVPEAPPALTVPKYVGAPHPDGYGLGELRAIFAAKSAPDSAFARDCDQAFVKLLTVSSSKDELGDGARELVRAEPLHYHWCFYSKIKWLHEELTSSDRFIEDKQKLVLEVYSFLGPVARAFISEFRDSRYLRWAVRDYRQVSEWVFFRKLDLTPQLTSELVEVSNPFGAWKDSSTAKGGVIDKYGLAVKSPYVGAAAGAAPGPVAEPGVAVTEPQILRERAPAQQGANPEDSLPALEPLSP